MSFLDLIISPAPHLDRLVVVIHEHYFLDAIDGAWPESCPCYTSRISQANVWFEVIAGRPTLWTSTARAIRHAIR
jgi:hypothetical protein